MLNVTRNHSPEDRRQFVRQLKIGTQLGQSDKPGGLATTVYYLESDERRAIRRFIGANEDIVADALAKHRNRFQHVWSDFLYGLLEEELRFFCVADLPRFQMLGSGKCR